MLVVTANLNGLRAANSKGFNSWLESASPDIVCVQETKAQMKGMQTLYPNNYYCHFSDADKKGYSGVGIYTKLKPLTVNDYGDPLFDDEGRYLEAIFENFIIISLYLPSGTSGEQRQNIKMQCLNKFLEEKLKPMANSVKPVIIAGDFNIAHKKIDLKNWQANQKKTGFLPEERAWFDSMLELGWRDVFRELNQAPEQYTWWSYRSAARARNVGWRLDYQIASCSKLKAVQAEIIRTPIISDHAPLAIKYELPT